VIDLLDRTFLFTGYKEYFRKLVPRDSEIVLAHNDAQENNILASLEDNTKITLIDYEYGGWNPMAMDIANYLNECAVDNAYPKGMGIKYYPCNFPTEFERNLLIKSYLEIHYEKLNEDKTVTIDDYQRWEKNVFPKFEQEVKQCCLMSSF